MMMKLNKTHAKLETLNIFTANLITLGVFIKLFDINASIDKSDYNTGITAHCFDYYNIR